jgi:type VI secretion system secreted protein VgrG
MMPQFPLGLQTTSNQDNLQLLRRIQDLEERLAKLEEALTVSNNSIQLKVENSTFVMKKDGSITLNGKDITIAAFGKISIKASSDLVLKGSKILQN